MRILNYIKENDFERKDEFICLVNKLIEIRTDEEKTKEYYHIYLQGFSVSDLPMAVHC